MTFVFMKLSQEIVFPNKKGRAETRLTSQMAEQLREEMTHQTVWCVCGGRLCPLLTTTPPTSPPPGTHDAVGRWRAPDEAVDLALFPMQGMLGLGAGDDGGSCWGDSIISEIREGRAPGWTPRGKFRSLYVHSVIQQTFSRGLRDKGGVSHKPFRGR